MKIGIDILSQVLDQVPSAQVGLTSLFGMGRGDPHRYSHLKLFTVIRMMYVIDMMQFINLPNHFTALSVIHLKNHMNHIHHSLISLTCDLMKE